MRRVFTLTAATLGSVAFAATAQAGNIADCELVIMTYVPDEDGGGMDVASFRPAGDFLRAVYAEDGDGEVVREIDGYPVRGLMCRRNDVIPDEEDYRILATGIPLALSQNFDSTDSDSLTVFFSDNEFRYKFASPFEMDEDVRAELETRLQDFSSRDHGLGMTKTEKDLASETHDD